MKAIKITIEGNISVMELPNDQPLYVSVRAEIGGRMEHVRPRGLDDPYCMIVDEEGLLKNLPLNAVGSILYGTAEHGCPIVGDILIMQDGFRDGEPDIVGLDDQDAEFLSEMLMMLKELTGNEKAV